MDPVVELLLGRGLDQVALPGGIDDELVVLRGLNACAFQRDVLNLIFARIVDAKVLNHNL